MSDIVERLRKPKAWMAWNDFGLVTINGDPIPPMEHDSSVPHEAANLIESLSAECEEQARLNGMGSEREARLQAKLSEAMRHVDHWLEYWNGDENEKAMADALHHILDGMRQWKGEKL